MDDVILMNDASGRSICNKVNMIDVGVILVSTDTDVYPTLIDSYSIL